MDKYLGKRLDGRYEMRELIGVGGMAYVYKAYDAVDDRIVAVKILKDEFLNNEEFVRRFRNESKAIAILNHPNIVKVLDVGFGERLQYIVMEYIDGITLKEYLDQRKDIRWKEAVHFTVQILRALQHAHDKGIVHRDIKPQNIMLLSDGTIKVTDFGIARLTRSDLKATVEGNKAIGSVHYISPEQARGEITDEKTDLYAVGIMLYEMLTGCLPFEADNAVSVAIMQMQSEAKAPHLINSEIPEGLEQITLKAMQKDTAKRYQSAAEMLSDFDEFKRNPSIKFEYTYLADESRTRYVDAIVRVRGVEPEPTVVKKEEPAATNTTTDDKNKKKNISLVVVLCLIAALTIGAVVWLIIWLLGNNEQVDEIKVDPFVGMYYTEVQGVDKYENKYDLDFVWEDAGNPKYAKGQIFKQSLAAGKPAKKGSKLTLYVNSATPRDIVLNVMTQVRGLHKDAMRDLLQDAGFQVIEERVSSAEVEKDCVVGISIVPGQKYPYGTTVTVNISKGASDLEPISFPNQIIGESKESAEQILRGYNFVGQIEYVEKNYTNSAYRTPGTVMGVETIDGTLPTEIAPDGLLKLIVSTGLKDVVVELEWPQTTDPTMMLDVRVKRDATLHEEFSAKYVRHTPYYDRKKMTFTITSHPDMSGDSYIFVVEIAKSGTNAYSLYTTLLIDPVNGTATMETPYQYLPGITPDTPANAIIPADFNAVGKSVDEIKALLTGLGLTVSESVETHDTIPADMVVRVDYNGVALTAGQELPYGAAVTIVISVGAA